MQSHSGGNTALPLDAIDIAPARSIRRYCRHPCYTLLCDDIVETAAEVLEHDRRGVSAGPSGNRAARMCRRAGLVETRDRHPMGSPAGDRPHVRGLRRVLRAAVA